MIDLLYLFCIYSVLGWVVEVLFFLIKTGKLQKRGILNGAYCPLYGFSLVISTIVVSNTINNIFFEFLICAVICTFFELITGLIFDKVLHHKMWDYNNIKYNFGGYICLPFAIIWGISALACIKILNPLLLDMVAGEGFLIKLIISVAVIAFMSMDLFSNMIERKEKHHGQN